jgi:GT2 family glycosyltransferase
MLADAPSPRADAAECYELIWRCTEQLGEGQIAHLPFVLYHAPAGRLASEDAIRRHQAVLQGHDARTGVAATVDITAAQHLRTRYTLPAALPLVSIVIPSKDRPALLRQCVQSVLDQTRYPHFEILFVDNGTTDPQALAIIEQLRADARFKVIQDASPFNYSRLNNAAVRQSRGEYICLMNNDVEITDPDWLHEMVSVSLQPDVGIVGARLLYPDTSLQHVGVIVGLGGVAGHAFKGKPSDDPCYMDRAVLTQEYSAVTAACLLTPRAVYDRVGGLNEDQLTIAFNDIDYCLKVRELGKKVVYTPHAEFIHHESASRGKEDTREKKARFASECQYMKARWGHWLAWDPAYNPNLTNSFEDLSLATPPRVAHRQFLRSVFSNPTPGKPAARP